MHLLMGASAPTKQMRISRCFFLLRQLFQFPHIGKFVHDLLEAAACDGADGCSDCALDQRAVGQNKLPLRLGLEHHYRRLDGGPHIHEHDHTVV